ncbi:GDSL-type esterase/lipase family protein [Solidesulfovibrio sp.]|uniref:SGNH/GDSL hydrolase family protein n=1 Tax=Solidesulfovibrio sp. TaxID=2910990 RepID=UPI00260C4E28|nr:GDSL-type esterase/lipase family protein [Solidesulfovibrio sp.]
MNGQLREIAVNVDTVNTVMNDLGGLYNRTRASILLTQLRSAQDDLVIVFGDSIVEQMYFPTLSGINVVNTGISGSKALESLSFMRQVLAGSHGPLVIVSMGANDAFGKSVASPERFAAGYEALAQAVLDSGRALVLATLPPMETGKFAADSFHHASIPSYNEQIREVGRRLGVPVADVDAVLEEWRKGRPEGCTVDGVHLNAQAAGVWRETVYAAAREAMAARKP